jgi:hypothetical protein
MKKMKLISGCLAIVLLTSCSNSEYEERFKKLEEKSFQLDSTNKALEKENLALKTEKDKKEEAKKAKAEEIEKARTTESLSFDGRFVGQWKFHSMNPPAHDGTMDGIICNLEKYSNTQKTYVFHLFTGNDLILSKKDANTLIGENANMSVKLNPNTGLLTLAIPGSSSWTFKKLR